MVESRALGIRDRNEQSAPWPKHTPSLADKSLLILDVVDHLAGGNHIERASGERQCLRIRTSEQATDMASGRTEIFEIEIERHDDGRFPRQDLVPQRCPTTNFE
jgi:hypothetical protein|tara:strand:+ start:113 stop:424 length:312 start_codon:yes stop_codon:yes gene_type:complete